MKRIIEALALDLQRRGAIDVHEAFIDASFSVRFCLGLYEMSSSRLSPACGGKNPRMTFQGCCDNFS
jgi:hypothetical protein